MTLVLARIDQRLIHGQVVMSWLPALAIDRIVVADDEIAADAWEREMVASAAPPDVEVEILGLADAAQYLSRGVPGTALLLVRSPDALLALVRAGAPVEEANVGGLHYREGSRRYLDYLYFTPEDIDALRTLSSLGLRLTARDLPGNPAVDLNLRLAPGQLDFDQLPAGP